MKILNKSTAQVKIKTKICYAFYKNKEKPFRQSSSVSKILEETYHLYLDRQSITYPLCTYINKLVT